MRLVENSTSFGDVELFSENISENSKGRRWPSVTLLGHATTVVTASEVVSSRGLIACARASVGDTRYAWCILFVKRHDVVRRAR